MLRWITDTETTDRFPFYTRGQADGVGPEPFSPLTWTLAWEQGAAPGTADGWVHLDGFRPEEFRHPVPGATGRFRDGALLTVDDATGTVEVVGA